MKTLLYIVAGGVLLYLLWKVLGRENKADTPLINTTQYARSEIITGGGGGLMGGGGGGFDFSSFL